MTPLLPFFFFNDTATTEIYTLSLHDALPIYVPKAFRVRRTELVRTARAAGISLACINARSRRRSHGKEEQAGRLVGQSARSEEHTSELQSRQYLVCRLLLEKKKQLKASRCNI